MLNLIFITDAENAQWTLAPKEEDAATTAEEREQEDVATAEEREQEDAATTAHEEREQEDAATAEEREQKGAATTGDAMITAEEREQEDVATTTEEREQEDTATIATEPQVEEREPKSKPTKLSNKNYLVLYTKLHKYSAEWREIGTHLGFDPHELNEIKAKPLLLSNAPKSWLGEMLADWLQWVPGDQRGSTRDATLEGLRGALNKADLPEAAQSITTEILKPTT